MTWLCPQHHLHNQRSMRQALARPRSFIRQHTSRRRRCSRRPRLQLTRSYPRSPDVPRGLHTPCSRAGSWTAARTRLRMHARRPRCMRLMHQTCESRISPGSPPRLYCGSSMCKTPRILSRPRRQQHPTSRARHASGPCRTWSHRPSPPRLRALCHNITLQQALGHPPSHPHRPPHNQTPERCHPCASTRRSRSARAPPEPLASVCCLRHMQRCPPQPCSLCLRFRLQRMPVSRPRHATRRLLRNEPHQPCRAASCSESSTPRPHPRTPRPLVPTTQPDPCVRQPAGWSHNLHLHLERLAYRKRLPHAAMQPCTQAGRPPRATPPPHFTGRLHLRGVR